MAIKSESWEQTRLAAYLDKNKYRWFHVPNGGYRHARHGAEMKRHGVKPGIPDIIIVGQPMIAIELKRTNGGRLSPHQKKWQAILEDNGWLFFVAHGSDAAIEWLESR